MVYCEAKAKLEGVTFERFALRDMRPKAVSARKTRGLEYFRCHRACGRADDQSGL